MRILIIEDELHLSEALTQILKKANFTVDTALDGEIGLDDALTNIYDLILLDIMLPKIDGLSILKELRKENINTPVLLLTARNQVDDRVKGLNLGADDYLAKPFAQEELIARIHALLRRKGNPIINEQLCIGNIILDYQNLTLSCNDKNITLTLKESELLQFLIIRKSSITPKDMLIEKLWGFNSEADSNNVEVYISFIRKKLKHLNSNVFIKTSRGLGYSLEVTNV
jgi:DNA-binding response OmpR family regulator